MSTRGSGRVFESHSEDETREIAKGIALNCKGNEVFKLIGDLGAGKTAFAKGFASGLNITGTINSPTFTIFNIYENGRLPLYHFDAYRLQNSAEFESSVGTEYFYAGGVCLIEWAGIIEDILPENCVSVTLEKDAQNPDPDYRRIIVENTGD
ncbi:hypothetical protein FACS189490_01250 [Clostridia bacterium]|nr:hypothetical protein FACS189490_01250 [Clostridia bacterium]